MQQMSLSILAQKTELHCLLILVSHHFQVWVHKIKDEKHVVLVLALKKGKKNYLWSFMVLPLHKEEWLLLQHG